MKRALGFIVFLFLLGGAVWVGVTSGPPRREPFEEVGLAPDIPIPWQRFQQAAGVHRSTFYFRPLANDLSRASEELFGYFDEAMPSQGWQLIDKELASDGAWSQVWFKHERLVQLTYGPELRGGEAELIVEQCPPEPEGRCRVGVIHPIEEF